MGNRAPGMGLLDGTPGTGRIACGKLRVDGIVVDTPTEAYQVPLYLITYSFCLFIYSFRPFIVISLFHSSPFPFVPIDSCLTLQRKKGRPNAPIERSPR
jgi:hypothetical protein